MEAATSAGTARAEAPGLSVAREKAGAVPRNVSAVMEINDIEEKARTRTIYVLVLPNVGINGLFQCPQRSDEEA